MSMSMSMHGAVCWDLVLGFDVGGSISTFVEACTLDAACCYADIRKMMQGLKRQCRLWK